MTYLLIPGAGGAGTWYWRRVLPLLERAIAVDLPSDDEARGLPEYVEAVVDAAGDADDVVLVAQSMGSFTAFSVCGRLPVSRLVLLNAMIPLPGETAGAWWENVDSEAARVAAAEAGGYSTELDLDTYFLHDLDPDLYACDDEQRPEADIAFGQPCHYDTVPPTTCWPAATIASSRSSSSGAWPASGSASTSSRSPGATSARSASPSP